MRGTTVNLHMKCKTMNLKDVNFRWKIKCTLSVSFSLFIKIEFTLEMNKQHNAIQIRNYVLNERFRNVLMCHLKYEQQ